MVLWGYALSIMTDEIAADVPGMGLAPFVLELDAVVAW